MVVLFINNKKIDFNAILRSDTRNKLRFSHVNVFYAIMEDN